jgi:hypothetical protein
MPDYKFKLMAVTAPNWRGYSALMKDHFDEYPTRILDRNAIPTTNPAAWAICVHPEHSFVTISFILNRRLCVELGQFKDADREFRALQDTEDYLVLYSLSLGALLRFFKHQWTKPMRIFAQELYMYLESQDFGTLLSRLERVRLNDDTYTYRDGTWTLR